MSLVRSFVSNIWTVYEPRAAEAVQDAPEEEKMKARLPGRDATDPAKDIDDSRVKQMGVCVAEATYATMGFSFYVLLVFLMFASFVNLFDNQISYSYTQTIVGAKFGKPTQAMTASALQSVILSVTKPFVGKISDIFGRATACTLVIIFYTVGFIVMASAQSLSDYFGGIVLWAIGNSGLQFIIQVLIADYISARNRALGISIMTIPTFIVFAVGPKIFGSVSNGPHWRWLAGMFTIMVPFVMVPLAVILAYNEIRARRAGLVPKSVFSGRGFGFFVKEFLLESDIGGLLILAGGFLMFLLPLNLASSQSKKYQTHWVIGLLTVGTFLILATPLYERFVSPRPFIRRQWLNVDVVLVMLLAFFDYLASNVTYQSLSYWSQLTMGLSGDGQLYFTSTQLVTLTLFGIVAGVIVRVTKRYKWIIVAAACIRMLGVGIMFRYRQRGTTMVQAVWPQIIQGIGGGVMGVLLQVAAQVTVRHQDVAMVTAAVLMVFELGGGVGSTVFTSLLGDQFVSKAAKHLPPNAPAEARGQMAYMFCAPTQPKQPPKEICNALIDGFNDVLRVSLIPALVFSAVPIICSLFLRDWKLTNTQNVISDEMPGKNVLSFRTEVPTTHDSLEDAKEEEKLPEMKMKEL